MDNFWIATMSVYGLMIGSFINAASWRFHEQHDNNLLPKKLSKKQQAQLSITKGRSICPKCKHKLGADDLVPVISWLALRGKCRYCKSPISFQYPLVELITAFLFVVSYISWPYELSGIAIAAFIVWLAIVAGFVMLAVYDVRWQLLPDKLLVPVIGLSVIYGILMLFDSTTIIRDIIGYIGGIAACSGIFYAMYQISNGKWIGGGDVKLGLSLGILVGSFISGLLVLMFASFIGLMVTIPFMIKKNIKMQSKIAFGPMLMLGCFIVVLYGDKLIDWYSETFLFL